MLTLSKAEIVETLCNDRHYYNMITEGHRPLSDYDSQVVSVSYDAERFYCKDDNFELGPFDTRLMASLACSLHEKHPEWTDVVVGKQMMRLMTPNASASPSIDATDMWDAIEKSDAQIRAMTQGDNAVISQKVCVEPYRLGLARDVVYALARKQGVTGVKLNVGAKDTTHHTVVMALQKHLGPIVEKTSWKYKIADACWVAEKLVLDAQAVPALCPLLVLPSQNEIVV